MRARIGKFFLLQALLCFFTFNADATQLIVNGGFETGSFSGWAVSNQAGSFAGSNFFVSNSTTVPLAGVTTVGPASGSFYAVSDQSGGGTHALTQVFTVPGPASSVILSFSMFVNSYGGNFVNPIGLDFTDGANQHGRVDLLTAGAGAFATTTAAGLIRNFYTGTDAGTNPHAYTSYSFDITPQVGAGGTFQLRFAEADNQLFLNLGVDNVSVDFTAAGVPEPGSFFLILLPVAAIATLHLRKQQKA